MPRAKGSEAPRTPRDVSASGAALEKARAPRSVGRAAKRTAAIAATVLPTAAVALTSTHVVAEHYRTVDDVRYRIPDASSVLESEAPVSMRDARVQLKEYQDLLSAMKDAHNAYRVVRLGEDGEKLVADLEHMIHDLSKDLVIAKSSLELGSNFFRTDVQRIDSRLKQFVDEHELTGMPPVDGLIGMGTGGGLALALTLALRRTVARSRARASRLDDAAPVLP